MSKKIEVLDLSGVGTGTVLDDLSSKEKRELAKGNIYRQFTSEDKFIEWTKDVASLDDDEEFLSGFDFDDVDDCKEYLDVMLYQVE